MDVRQSPATAVALMILATALIAATMVLGKVLGSDLAGPPLHPFQITFGRYCFAFLTLMSIAAVLRPEFTQPDWPVHFGRASCGFAGVTLMFAAVAFIPLPDAMAISFLNPVFAMILAIPLLGERVGPIRWGAAVLALCGAIILLRPTVGTFQPEALLAFGAAVVLGVEIILIKRLSGQEGAFQILLVANIIGLGLSIIAVLFVWQPLAISQWMLMIALGMFMAAAQTCFVNAMARAEASFIAPFSYATLIFAALYDAVLFGTIPGLVSWIGAGIIIAGAIILALREAHHQHTP